MNLRHDLRHTHAAMLIAHGGTQKSSSSGWDTHRFRSPLTPKGTCLRAWMRLPPTVSMQHVCGLAPFRTCTNSLAETQPL